MDFGPNAEIGRKMANNQLLFLALNLFEFCKELLLMTQNSGCQGYRLYLCMKQLE